MSDKKSLSVDFALSEALEALLSGVPEKDFKKNMTAMANKVRNTTGAVDILLDGLALDTMERVFDDRRECLVDFLIAVLKPKPKNFLSGLVERFLPASKGEASTKHDQKSIGERLLPCLETLANRVEYKQKSGETFLNLLSFSAKNGLSEEGISKCLKAAEKNIWWVGHEETVHKMAKEGTLPLDHVLTFVNRIFDGKHLPKEKDAQRAADIVLAYAKRGASAEQLFPIAENVLFQAGFISGNFYSYAVPAHDSDTLEYDSKTKSTLIKAVYTMAELSPDFATMLAERRILTDYVPVRTLNNSWAGCGRPLHTPLAFENRDVLVNAVGVLAKRALTMPDGEQYQQFSESVGKCIKSVRDITYGIRDRGYDTSLSENFHSFCDFERDSKERLAHAEQVKQRVQERKAESKITSFLEL